MSKLKMLLLCSVVLGLMFSPVARADRYVVAPGAHMGTPAHPYDSWSNAATNIQTAVDAANDGETIWVSNGIYKATGAGKLFLGTNMVYLEKNRKLLSVNGPEVTILDGGYPELTNRPVCLNSTGSVLSGFSVVNGCLSRGGGVLIGSYGGMVSNCMVYSNISAPVMASEGGGGIASSTTDGYTGYFYNCSVYGNTAIISNSGGGAWFRGSVVLSDCEFYTNRCLSGSQQGGGCYIRGDVKMNRCVFSNNYAELSSGGGVYIYVGKLIAEGCTFVNNSANSGGGIFTRAINTDTIISNCLISGNTAFGAAGGGGVSMDGAGRIVGCLIASNRVTTNSSSSVGGGIKINSANAVCESCTVVDNSVNGGSGGGIHMSAAGQVINTVIYGNTAPTGPEWYPAGVGSFSNCCTANTNGMNGSGNIAADPKFVDAAAGNYRLPASSPCVNAGLNQDWMIAGVDKDGRPRLDRFVKLVDIGCYEHQFQGVMFLIK